MPAKNAVKYPWIIDEENFLKRNFYSMTNQELADAIGITLTVLRNKCYELGMKKMELQYWTTGQVNFLTKNYKFIGDTELAELFTKRWSKNKGWTKKHIEKKRRYLKLKRTPAEIKAIHKRNVENGAFKMCPVKAWETRGVNPIGSVIVWKNKFGRDRAYIKTPSGYVVYARWLWEQNHGKLSSKKLVSIKGDKIIPDGIKDLELISRAENARRNKQGFDSLPTSLKTAIKLTNKIKKQL